MFVYLRFVYVVYLEIRDMSSNECYRMPAIVKNPKIWSFNIRTAICQLFEPR